MSHLQNCVLNIITIFMNYYMSIRKNNICPRSILELITSRAEIGQKSSVLQVLEINFFTVTVFLGFFRFLLEFSSFFEDFDIFNVVNYSREHPLVAEHIFLEYGWESGTEHS